MNTCFKTVIVTLTIALFFSCNKENEHNFTLNGNIKGLKKGKVYLQTEGDSSIVNIDSLEINGTSSFSFSVNINEPQLMYLNLNKKDNKDHFIPFFAEPGITEINTTLKNFNYDAKVTGNKQQELLNEYLKVMSRFNDRNLALLERQVEAFKTRDSIANDSINKALETLVKRKYSYTIQYALNNTDNEIAPYLALYEIPSANPIYIDSVYNNLSDKIKKSKYGKRLKNYISEIKPNKIK